MDEKRERGRPKYRLTVKLDLEWDAELIRWLEGHSPGSRSAMVRSLLRAGMREPAQWEPVDIDELRRVVAEELDRALSQRSIRVDEPAAAGDPAAPGSNEAEAQYGAKLDKMLGGLSRPKAGGSEGG